MFYRLLLPFFSVLFLTVSCQAADKSPGSNSVLLLDSEVRGGLSYVVVDTGQEQCYGDAAAMVCPGEGSDFYGQDAQFDGTRASYRDNGDGTVSDLNSGIMWQRSPDSDGNGEIDALDKMTFSQAKDYCQGLTLAGHDDWRLPDIKQLYSLIDFRGTDISGQVSASGATPFIDDQVFEFAYGDTSAGERLIDSQYASSTEYVSGDLLFGVNFADGRIKGYGLTVRGMDKTFLVMCARQGESYGVNAFRDNGDGTVSDLATGLMWAQADSGQPLNWEEALAWVRARNGENHLGHADWRLPNIKELQSLVDYSRSPDKDGTAAIDPLFSSTPITNEGGEADFPYYWSGTTHITMGPQPGAAGAYVAFGRGLGYDGNFSQWIDVHGAGCQRSDPKAGDPADYPFGFGPQGDARRIYNFVRLVR